MTKRATRSTDAVQKKDLYGTDKSHPSILKGNSTSVWFVEGGADALALHDIAKRQGKELPTVVVTGGARVYSCLRNRQVKDLVKESHSVYVAYENESTPEKQKITDAGHDKQMEIIKKETGREVARWKHEGAKDLAELNSQVTKVEKSVDRDRGLSL